MLKKIIFVISIIFVTYSGNNLQRELEQCRSQSSHSADIGIATMNIPQETINKCFNRIKPELARINVDIDNDNLLKKWISFLSGTMDKNMCPTNIRLSELINSSDTYLENTHNYIQVMFPNIKQSSYSNANLYLDNAVFNSRVTFKDVFKVILNDHIFGQLITENTRYAFYRMMKFYGLEIKDKTLITKNTRVSKWNNGNHNQLRVTRILNWLMLCNLQEEFSMLMVALEKYGDIYSYNRFWSQIKYSTSLLISN